MKNLSFKEHYELARRQPTPREVFITKIAHLTHRSKRTVQKWLMGICEPDFNTKQLLSRYLKTPVHILFPEHNNSTDDEQQ